MLPLEGTLLEKLRKIEALHAGTKIDGEREAAKRAAERIRARLDELRGREKEVVLLYSLPDPWKRKLFVALCRRYGLKPYRQPGRRYSTVMVRAPQTFQDQTLHPEFVALAEELDTHLGGWCPTVGTRRMNRQDARAAKRIMHQFSPFSWRSWRLGGWTPVF